MLNLLCHVIAGLSSVVIFKGIIRWLFGSIDSVDVFGGLCSPFYLRCITTLCFFNDRKMKIIAKCVSQGYNSEDPIWLGIANIL